MKRRTFQLIGGAIVFGLATEAIPNLSSADEDCVIRPTAFCGPAEEYALLEREQVHVPEQDFDVFPHDGIQWVASGQSISTPSTSNPYRMTLAGEGNPWAYGRNRKP